jgi:hypothetical protein
MTLHSRLTFVFAILKCNIFFINLVIKIDNQFECRLQEDCAKQKYRNIQLQFIVSEPKLRRKSYAIHDHAIPKTD